jgi:hypothetical protein
MSGKSNANTQGSNDISSQFIEGIALAQSIAISLIDTYSEFVRKAPEMIDQWYNIFWNLQNTTEKQRRDKVKVE